MTKNKKYTKGQKVLILVRTNSNPNRHLKPNTVGEVQSETTMDTHILIEGWCEAEECNICQWIHKDNIRAMSEIEIQRYLKKKGK